MEGKYPYCMSANLSKEDFWSHVSCVFQVREESDIPCHDSCQAPCKVTDYTTITSNVKWPKKSRYSTFYDRVIANKTYAWRFSALQENNTFDATFKAAATPLVEDNFARLDISLGNTVIKRYKDIKKISLTSFLASLGGTLNLWCGITVVILLECIDWVLKICIHKLDDVKTVDSKQKDNKPV